VDNVSVTVEPGSSLGIVGSSGSGKTTTVDLICGLLSPSSGEVLIDGQDPVVMRDAAPIGYVAQDVFLLDATVRENIVFSEEPVDETRLQRAVHLAQLNPWIATLPDGLDTNVGERGALVSGGQRQRIGIARALYTEPVLLIMDEATSALDVETEAALTSAIAELDRAVTLVVIAHRLSTVRGCDQILVLSDGAAVGLGSYDNLATEHELFSRWASLATGSDQSETNGHVGDERVADAR
jgi:ABC-type multidrug transport system fused ATPase/permease subunit